jgi:hypothetical protein
MNGAAIDPYLCLPSAQLPHPKNPTKPACIVSVQRLILAVVLARRQPQVAQFVIGAAVVYMIDFFRWQITMHVQPS